MSRYIYKAITFAKDWTGSFADFKAEFENIHVFKKLLPAPKDRELRKVYKALLKHTKDNGSISRTADESTQADAE